MFITFDQVMSLVKALAEFGSFSLMLYTAIAMRQVKHATNSLLDARVDAAQKVGHAEAMETMRVEKREDEAKHP